MKFLQRLIFLLIVLASFNQTVIAKDKWNRAYLSTYPRSGNHWVRFFLEEATHIATGSVYRDKEPGFVHLKIPFPWGGYAVKNGYHGDCRYPKMGDIVVVKTHYPAKPKTKFDLLRAFKVIRIVRHPVDSFYSHFQHEINKKRHPKNGKVPRWYIEKSIVNWRRFIKFWDDKSNVVTIRYEDMLEDPRSNFQKIIDELGYEIEESDFERALEKNAPQGQPLKHLEHFKKEDLQLINDQLGLIMKKLNYSIPAGMLKGGINVENF